MAESEGSAARASDRAAPPASTVATSGRPDGAHPVMSIGEVLAHLRPEFPDTTISKLRFLESEGLIEPSRSQSGYRKYSWDDVARLTYILTAQRDQYLPLRVIREQLEDLDAGGEPPARMRPPLVAVDQVAAGQSGELAAGAAATRLSRAELIEAAGLTEARLRDLEQYGLVAPHRGGFYDADALQVARLVGRLGEYGLEPRHLRAYRTAADREIGLFEQVIAPMLAQRGGQARARAAETARELAALSLRLRAALVQAGLRDTLGG